jgi:uncharacterized repeat protein (TIGR03803 family)
MESANGNLYGMTMWGGAYGKGIIYEYDYVNNIFTKKLDFSGFNGRNPYYGHLIEINIPVGLNTAFVPSEKMDIYPNPASDKVTINFNAARNGYSHIMVTDLTGRRVISTSITASTGKNQIELHLGGCNPGLYHLQITDADGNRSVKPLAVK